MIAVSWEVSAHTDGPSIIENGIYKGMKFDEYINKNQFVLGKKGMQYNAFPILIKFIDAL